MPELVGYELGNSAASIPPETWQHDGVLEDILGPLAVEGILEIDLEPLASN